MLILELWHFRFLLIAFQVWCKIIFWQRIVFFSFDFLLLKYLIIFRFLWFQHFSKFNLLQRKNWFWIFWLAWFWPWIKIWRMFINIFGLIFINCFRFVFYYWFISYFRVLSIYIDCVLIHSKSISSFLNWIFYDFIFFFFHYL